MLKFSNFFFKSKKILKENNEYLKIIYLWNEIFKKINLF
jgi:hypothetical protein